MAAAHTICLTIFVALCALTGFTADATITNYDDTDCIIDTQLEAEAPGNYHDCNVTEAIEANRTRCCKMDGETTCCDNSRNERMIWIGITIGLVTVGVMLTCLIVFWYDTIPCLTKCLAKCCSCCCKDPHYALGEEEMDDLAEQIRNSNKSYVKWADEYAPDSREKMPEEFKAATHDEWWGTMPDGNKSILQL